MQRDFPKYDTEQGRRTRIIEKSRLAPNIADIILDYSDHTPRRTIERNLPTDLRQHSVLRELIADYAHSPCAEINIKEFNDMMIDQSYRDTQVSSDELTLYRPRVVPAKRSNGCIELGFTTIYNPSAVKPWLDKYAKNTFKRMGYRHMTFKSEIKKVSTYTVKKEDKQLYKDERSIRVPPRGLYKYTIYNTVDRAALVLEELLETVEKIPDYQLEDFVNRFNRLKIAR